MGTGVPPITPIDAILFAWSMSQIYSEDDRTRSLGLDAQNRYKSRLEKFDKNDPKDCDYLGTLIPAMDVTLKNLSTYLKNRNDHFKQAEKLRDDQIEAVKQLDQFALNFQTAFPKIASSTAIGGVTGLSLKGTLESFGLKGIQIDLIILSFLGFGYLITEAVIVPIAAKRTKRLVNKFDKLKREYYQVYIARCKDELSSLLNTMRYAYESAYRSSYNLPTIDGKVWSIDYVTPLEEREVFVPEY